MATTLAVKLRITEAITRASSPSTISAPMAPIFTLSNVSAGIAAKR